MINRLMVVLCILFAVGCAKGNYKVQTLNYSGYGLPEEYRPEAYTEDQHRELDKLLNELNTPGKVTAWRQIAKNFQYDYMWYGYCKGTKHPNTKDWWKDMIVKDFRPPIVLYVTGLAVCHELANFAANALMRAGYEVALIGAVRYGTFMGGESGHIVCAYKSKKDGNWYTIGDTRNFRRGPFSSPTQAAYEGVTFTPARRIFMLPVIPAKKFDSQE